MRSSAIIFVMLLLVLSIFVLTPAAAAAPTDAAGWTALGRNLTDQKNYTEAFQAYDQAIALDPNYAAAWDGKADALNRANQYTADPLATLNMALANSNQALALNASSANEWINHGQILYTIGAYYQNQLNDKTNASLYYNEQLDSFEKAISVEPDNADAWFNKAYALCGMGRCNEGVVAFQKVEELDPNYPNLQANLDIAEKLAATETPFYIKYDVEIVLAAIALICAALWVVAVRKKY
ncbi:tetratricopeptide repeat protein [Methanoregula sp.]|jgi:cytochrome c-type biogenesis protein CcmH/NrfG|uniref:tetratricopeptide repeat protein n=1 Tax=Methanoregula sp. TaxID=2052170 RepID=UPI0025D870A8|nr:tetratricopeptide repeat protein [Methanoregula sp.]